MGTITINGKKYTFTDEKNVLTIIRKAGIDLPTLCYHSDLSTFGACRLCTVENDRGQCFASCSEEPRDGMVIYTHTERLRRHRKLIIELLLAAHCRDCTTCMKSGECVLQDLAHKMGVREVRFEDYKEFRPIDYSSPSIVRDPNKCILCGNCVRVCSEIQGVGVLGFAHRGTDAEVIPAFNKKLSQTHCVSCGQCRVYCPTGALTIRTHLDEVYEALGDPNVRVVAQIAPAVRVAVGDAFGLPNGTNAMGKVVAALHSMGFDEVFDTSYTADLTVMEESAEFLDRVKNGGKLPLLTSCCPAWVKFVDNEFPEMKENVSTCRSPQGMFSAVIKEYYRDLAHAKGKKTFVVSIMPCTAKKMEARREEFRDAYGVPYVDLVLTTQEVVQMMKESGIRFQMLEKESPDLPYGMGSGAAEIFGTSGGVAEAVIRCCTTDKSKNALRTIEHSGIRGTDAVRFAEVTINGRKVRAAIVHGLGSAAKLLDQIRSGEVQADLVEVMSCRTGCVGGAGQPYALMAKKLQRAQGLYEIDRSAMFKRSERNPVIDAMYANGLADRAHELLHIEYKD